MSDIQPAPGAYAVTQADLDAFEADRGITLSVRHRHLLLTQDGGLLPGCHVPIPDAPVCSAQPTFWHGLSSGELEDEYDWYSEIIGRDLVPFCSDPAGSVFCYRLDPSGTERIYFASLPHSREDEEGRLTYPLYPVTVGLDTFIAQIRSDLPSTVID